jgi:hypothetical protein
MFFTGGFQNLSLKFCTDLKGLVYHFLKKKTENNTPKIVFHVNQKMVFAFASLFPNSLRGGEMFQI